MRTRVMGLGLLFLFCITLSWAQASDPTVLVYKGNSKNSGFEESSTGGDPYYYKGTDKIYLVLALDLDDGEDPIEDATLISYWVENGVNQGDVMELHDIETIMNVSMVAIYSDDLFDVDENRTSLYLEGLFKQLAIKPDGIKREIPKALRGYGLSTEAEDVGAAAMKLTLDTKRTKEANIDINEENLEQRFDAAISDIVNDFNIHLNN